LTVLEMGEERLNQEKSPVSYCQNREASVFSPLVEAEWCNRGGCRFGVWRGHRSRVAHETIDRVISH
jgi:hypothetical protein